MYKHGNTAPLSVPQGFSVALPDTGEGVSGTLERGKEDMKWHGRAEGEAGAILA